MTTENTTTKPTPEQIRETAHRVEWMRERVTREAARLRIAGGEMAGHLESHGSTRGQQLARDWREEWERLFRAESDLCNAERDKRIIDRRAAAE